MEQSIEVGMWVVPQPTYEAAGLDWQVTDIIGEAAVLKWTDTSYREVFRNRVVPLKDFWNKYHLVRQLS